MLVIVQVVVGALILIIFMKSFTGFIDFATSVVFLASPFLAYFNHRAVMLDEVPAELQPGKAASMEYSRHRVVGDRCR